MEIKPAVPIVVRLEFRRGNNGSGLECRVYSDGRLSGTRHYDDLPTEFYVALSSASIRCLGLRVIPLATPDKQK